ncbi:membrane protein [Cystobacter fuscus]|uniref:Membrane protein n=1 Tax=Cystobacter fuscus TaxID=43 RepID=A0A250JH69_9BACT|nr:hypothetical protein [Cystobacter fuscus]ATB42751.1 membrane protein [Cystobacter fuscus]
MILGLSISTLTIIHVLFSLVGIAAGLVWLLALTNGRWLSSVNVLFFTTTVLTTVTSFLFPITIFTPALGVAIISAIDLAIATHALLRMNAHPAGKTTYIITATIALYLNCFVGVVQAFLKIAPLHALAPNGTEPPFAAAQAATLIAFVMLGILAVRRSRPLAALSTPSGG